MGTNDPVSGPADKFYNKLVCEVLEVSVTETIDQMFDARMKRLTLSQGSATTRAETEENTSPLRDTPLPIAGIKRKHRHLSEIVSTPKRAMTQTSSPSMTSGNDGRTDIALPSGNIKDLSIGFQTWFSKLTNGFKVEREEIDHAKAKCDEMMEQLEVQRTALHAKESRIDQWISTERQTGKQLKTDASLLDERYTKAKEMSAELEHRRLLLRLDERRHAQVLEQIETEKDLL